MADGQGNSNAVSGDTNANQGAAPAPGSTMLGDGTGVAAAQAAAAAAKPADGAAAAQGDQKSPVALALEAASANVKSINDAQAALANAKTDDEKKAAQTALDKLTAPKGAPEKYSDFTLPQGVTVDPEQLTGFQSVAKELGLNQEQAQKLVDFEAKRMTGQQNSGLQAWTKVREGWVNEAKSNPEFGGAKFDESLSQAKGFLKEFGSPQLIEALDQTGMGDNPHLLFAFARAGRAMANDTMHSGRAGGAPADVAKSLYNNSQHN